MSVPIWVEYAKLGVSALTPLVTGIVGFVILRLGVRLERSKQLNQVLLQKRLSFYEEVAPRLNDIYCFCQTIGHWSELDPKNIIERKRSIDRAFYINHYLFADRIANQYFKFIHSHFELYTGVGKAARLRLDQEFIKGQIGAAFKDDWNSELSTKLGHREEQRQAYEALMSALGKEVKGENAS